MKVGKEEAMNYEKKIDVVKADEAWRMFLELNNGDVKAAEKMCINFSRYVKKDGTPGGGKPHPHNLSEGELNVVSNKIIFYYLSEMRDREEIEKLKVELHALYKQNEKAFDEIITQNGYTHLALEEEKNETVLKKLINEIKGTL